MKILVYGAGAVGGYLGARLARRRHDVTLIVRPVTAAAINAYGVIVTENDQRWVAHAQTVTSVPQAFKDGKTYDLILLGVKAYDLAAALDPLVAFCPDPPTLITTQNGIGVEQPMIDQYGAERVVAGSFTIPISKEATHQLIVEKSGCGMGLAPTQAGQSIKTWVELFKNAGVDTVGVKDYESMKWSKALLNIVGNAASAILNRPPGVIYKSDTVFELEMRMLREALAVMKARNLKIVDLPGWSPKRLAFAVRRLPKLVLKPMLTGIVSDGRGDKMPSFYIDLTEGKGKSEVIYHNGAIARAAKAVGVKAPVNAAYNDILLRLAREELDWRKFDGRPKRLLAVVRKYEKAMQRTTG